MNGKCGHCEREFELSPHQKYNVIHFNWTSYCSKMCQMAALRAKRKAPLPKPNKVCPTCGGTFTSKYYDKTYCSLKCYVENPKSKEQLKVAGHKGNVVSSLKAGNRPGAIKINCLECGTELTIRPSQKGKRKYCNHTCYRRYMAKRFDRWIASPQTIALPQNYDEFLTLEELPCLVEGCNWRGHFLSVHMNAAHGVPAEEFKRAAGFNLKSGIISAPLQEIFRSWSRHFGPNNIPFWMKGVEAGAEAIKKSRPYKSLEGTEHRMKAMALKLAEEGDLPMRVCRGCGKVFQQPHPFGKKLYCSTECRSQDYLKRYGERKYPCKCSVCGRPFKGTRDQMRRTAKGLVVACSFYCRQKRASKIGKGTWSKEMDQSFTHQLP